MMRKSVIKFLLPGVFILSACGTYMSESDKTGTIGIAVEWPKIEISKTLRIKEIPADTVKLKVEITGEGITDSPMQPVVQEIKRPETRLLVTKVPKGKKTVLAIAYDENDNILAEGKTDVVVEANKLTRAVVSLNPKNISISIPLFVLPSSSPKIDIGVGEVISTSKPQIIGSSPPLDPTLLPTIKPSSNIFPSPINSILSSPSASNSTNTGSLTNYSPQIVSFIATPTIVSGGGYATLLAAQIKDESSSVSFTLIATKADNGVAVNLGLFEPAATGRMSTGLLNNYGKWIAPTVTSNTIFRIKLEVSDGQYSDTKFVDITVQGGPGTLNTGPTTVKF